MKVALRFRGRPEVGHHRHSNGRAVYGKCQHGASSCRSTPVDAPDDPREVVGCFFIGRARVPNVSTSLTRNTKMAHRYRLLFLTDFRKFRALISPSASLRTEGSDAYSPCNLLGALAIDRASVSVTGLRRGCEHRGNQTAVGCCRSRPHGVG